MNKEEKRKYIFAQLRNLPNATQYVEVTKYIDELEQQCKKQKEVIDKAIRNTELLEQQKEFINYINDYIKLLKDKPDLVEEGQKDILEEILSKYKEIIGGINENQRN